MGEESQWEEEEEEGSKARTYGVAAEDKIK
jgi:hypothetical protein